MKTEYQIYTPSLKQGAWKWGQRTAIYVIYGPTDELATFRTIASVECIDYNVDSRYGQSLREASDWIDAHSA